MNEQPGNDGFGNAQPVGEQPGTSGYSPIQHGFAQTLPPIVSQPAAAVDTMGPNVGTPYGPPLPMLPPADPSAAVSIRALFKRFGNNVAVNGLSLDIPVGSFYGLVGPNGAGKTTTLTMLTGLLKPDAGMAMILGVDVWNHIDQAKRIIGVMPQSDQIFDRLTGLQLLMYAGMLRGMPRIEVTRRANDLLGAFDLLGAANKAVADYSSGMTKKICLATAMIHSPRLLVLDEPFESVDPVSSANLRDILIEYVQTGGTVIVSSHVMAMVQKMCTHVAVIDHGQVKAAGTVAQVAAGEDLEDRFLDLVGGRHAAARLDWLNGGGGSGAQGVSGAGSDGSGAFERSAR